MKICSKCKTEQDINYFYKSNKNTDGHRVRTYKRIHKNEC